MLEKIGQPEFAAISTPDNVVLRYLDELLLHHEDIVYYEVGVGVGATTLPVVQRLAGRGRVMLFSRDVEVKELAEDLRRLGFNNIDSSWGSPGNTFSGYHFELARGFVAGALPQFDLAYLDGGHVFHLDAPAAAVLKELCKVGGYVILDDWNWSLAQSPTQKPALRPRTAEEFDTRQIEARHVPLVCQTIMDTDQRFAFLGVEHDSAVYQRVAIER